MAASVFTGVVFNTLKATLDNIVEDSTDGIEKKVTFPKWCTIKDMDDHYEDDMMMGGPGLLSEKPEGGEIPATTMREGPITRYIARTFAAKIILTEEVMEDSKYPKTISVARKLKRSGWKSADIDASLMLQRATNAAYVGGDGVPLASTAHLLPNGGTYSNMLATPMTPSRASFIIARSMAMKMTGLDGTIDGADIKAVLCPVEQWAVWESLVKSTKAPESGSNEINVANTHSFDIIPIPYWNNTTTQYAFVTDVDNGLQFRWRRRLRSRSWVDHNNELMSYAVSARWARGWTDPRSIIFVNA